MFKFSTAITKPPIYGCKQNHQYAEQMPPQVAKIFHAFKCECVLNKVIAPNALWFYLDEA